MLKLVMAALLLATSPALAQAPYPNRPITLVAPFAAGSGTDAMTRELAEQLSRKLGQTVLVENKPGANGVIAVEYAARAPADGYTLLMAGNSTHSANPHLFKALKYDPIKDFTPIARLATAPFVLVVNPKEGPASLADLLKIAKESPGKLSYGAPSSAATVSGETMKQVAKVDITQVPYRQSPQSMTDVIGGSLSMAFVDVAAAQGNIKGGTLRALVTTGAKRSSILPDTPTLSESGFPGVDIIAWVGVFGPAKVAPEITATLNQAVKDVMTSDQIRSRLTLLGLDYAYAPPEEMGPFVQSELTKWGEMIQKAGIQPQ